jgi:hypothetical protein
VREGTPPETAPRRGDAFPGGHHLPLASQAELARLFGPGFSERVLALAPGTWSEPLPSIHGLHLVFAHERRDAEPLPLARVHARARAELLEEHVATNLAAELARLRTRYAVRVEGAVPVAAGAGS